MADWAASELMKIPKLYLLGHRNSNECADGHLPCGNNAKNIRKLPIFSFLIRCKDRFLHHNFVCALLNDLFGIQARGNS